MILEPFGIVLSKPSTALKPRETFPFAAVMAEHGHLYNMIEGLTDAGATLKWVYDPDPVRQSGLCHRFPQAKVAASLEEILDDPAVRLIAAAAVPADRCALGIRVMEAGKDYFTDKAPLTSLEQLAMAKEAVMRTGKKYLVYYSERLRSECAVAAEALVNAGAIGRVIQVTGFGPHRLNAPTRPQWFFQKKRYGGILCDIGSHQIEQFLFFTKAKSARIVCAHVANLNHPQTPELEDLGETMLAADNGATGYFRVDWFTPDGLRAWGDGRVFLVGTEGFLEMRKICDLAANDQPDHLLLCNGRGEYRWDVSGKIGYPFFSRLIRDCLDRTETAMEQEHAFLAAELAVRAQMAAEQNPMFTTTPFVL